MERSEILLLDLIVPLLLHKVRGPENTNGDECRAPAIDPRHPAVKNWGGIRCASVVGCPLSIVCSFSSVFRLSLVLNRMPISPLPA